jgi:hypothetical protein
MLSFKKGGRKIARVSGGPDNGKFIYLKGLNDEKNPEEINNPLNGLSKNFFKKHRRMKKQDILLLNSAIKEGQMPVNEDLQQIYKDAMEDIRKRARNGLTIKGGKLVPLPNRKVIEKIYVSAPSGAGKSTWCGKWLCEYKKMFKDNDTYVFSTIGQDKALDIHDPIRIDLTEELLDDPISPEEIKQSVCVFDDVDTITNPQIRNNVCGLREWLLEQGRHFGIRMLITSHLLMKYQATRLILSEADAVCFFPKCGSTYHIKRFLTTYAGLEKSQIKRILNLPSRWVCVYQKYPMYVMYEKGVYMLSNDDDE